MKDLICNVPLTTVKVKLKVAAVVPVLMSMEGYSMYSEINLGD